MGGDNATKYTGLPPSSIHAASARHVVRIGRATLRPFLAQPVGLHRLDVFCPTVHRPDFFSCIGKQRCIPAADGATTDYHRLHAQVPHGSVKKITSLCASERRILIGATNLNQAIEPALVKLSMGGFPFDCRFFAVNSVKGFAEYIAF